MSLRLRSNHQFLCVKKKRGVTSNASMMTCFLAPKDRFRPNVEEQQESVK
jgi:hypothetical protein